MLRMHLGLKLDNERRTRRIAKGASSLAALNDPNASDSTSMAAFHKCVRTLPFWIVSEFKMQGLTTLPHSWRETIDLASVAGCTYHERNVQSSFCTRAGTVESRTAGDFVTSTPSPLDWCRRRCRRRPLPVARYDIITLHWIKVQCWANQYLFMWCL